MSFAASIEALSVSLAPRSGLGLWLAVTSTIMLLANYSFVWTCECLPRAHDFMFTVFQDGMLANIWVCSNCRSFMFEQLNVEQLHCQHSVYFVKKRQTWPENRLFLPVTGIQENTLHDQKWLWDTKRKLKPHHLFIRLFIIQRWQLFIPLTCSVKEKETNVYPFGQLTNEQVYMFEMLWMEE